MKDFKAIWKQRASNKQNTAEDMVSYCILKAMAAKSTDKRDLTKALIEKAFSPKNNPNTGESKHQALIDTCNNHQLKHESVHRNIILGVHYMEIFDSEEELKCFRSLLKSLAPYDFDRVYSYIFVRQDISPEYQLVQASHATMVTGQKLNPDFDASNIHFTIIGVKDIRELLHTAKLLYDNNFAYDMFYEPDLPGHTAIATQPIHWKARAPLKHFKLLKFGA